MGLLCSLPIYTLFCAFAVDARGWWGLPVAVGFLLVANIGPYAVYYQKRTLRGFWAFVKA